MTEEVADPFYEVPGFPFVGNLLAFRRDLLGLLKKVSRSKADIAEIKVGSGRLYFLNSPELAQLLLSDQADAIEKRASHSGPRARLLGEGLINSEGAFHARERKLCTPPLQPHNIAPFAEVMREHVVRTMSAWKNGDVVDLAAEMNRLTLGIAGETLFGSDLAGEVDEIRADLTAARSYLRARNGGLFHLPAAFSAQADRHFQSAVARLDKTIYRLISEREKQGADRNDLLSRLLSAHRQAGGTGLTTRQVRDEIVNLLWGGHEPAAITLTACWYLLVNNSHVYAKMQDELDRVLADRPLTSDDLSKLIYTQQVLKEALRLLPPIFAFGRQSLRPLTVAGHTLPAGTNFMLSPYTLHRRQDIYPDPDRFDPDRFTPQAEEQRPRFSYLPFGSGPRFCIGSHYAQMEALVVLATIGSSVSFSPIKGDHIKPDSLITDPGARPVRMLVTLRTP